MTEIAPSKVHDLVLRALSASFLTWRADTKSGSRMLSYDIPTANTTSGDFSQPCSLKDSDPQGTFLGHVTVKHASQPMETLLSVFEFNRLVPVGVFFERGALRAPSNLPGDKLQAIAPLWHISIRLYFYLRCAWAGCRVLPEHGFCHRCNVSRPSSWERADILFSFCFSL